MTSQNMGTCNGMLSIPLSKCSTISLMPPGSTVLPILLILVVICVGLSSSDIQPFQSIWIPSSYPIAFVSSTPSCENITTRMPDNCGDIFSMSFLVSAFLWCLRPISPRKIYFFMSSYHWSCSESRSSPVTLFLLSLSIFCFVLSSRGL